MMQESASRFFAATCHPVLPRRQFLAGGGAVLVAARLGRGSGPALAGQASDDGTAIVRQYATAPGDPWIVAHGVRAMGSDFRLKGGRRAVDYLLEDMLATIPAGRTRVLGFPPEVEVHPNMFLKTMLEAGVPLDYSFTHDGHRRTLRDLVEGARALFRPKLVISDPNALPWSIIALTRMTTALRPHWTNAWSEQVDLDLVVERALVLLEQASLPVAQAMREGRPETAKAPVHSFTCGGTHMIYGLLTAMSQGYVGKDRLPRMQQQVDLLVWRLRADVDLMGRFYQGSAANEGAFWYELDDKLKLLGHAEECLAFTALHEVVKLTPSQQAERQAAVADLRRMLGDLEARKLGEVKELDRELYQLLIGDTCHARHGLTLA